MASLAACSYPLSSLQSALIIVECDSAASLNQPDAQFLDRFEIGELRVKPPIVISHRPTNQSLHTLIKCSLVPWHRCLRKIPSSISQISNPLASMSALVLLHRMTVKFLRWTTRSRVNRCPSLSGTPGSLVSKVRNLPPLSTTASKSIGSTLVPFQAAFRKSQSKTPSNPAGGLRWNPSSYFNICCTSPYHAITAKPFAEIFSLRTKVKKGLAVSRLSDLAILLIKIDAPQRETNAAADSHGAVPPFGIGVVVGKKDRLLDIAGGEFLAQLVHELAHFGK